jgi:hypothetical protein
VETQVEVGMRGAKQQCDPIRTKVRSPGKILLEGQQEAVVVVAERFVRRVR